MADPWAEGSGWAEASSQLSAWPRADSAAPANVPSFMSTRHLLLPFWSTAHDSGMKAAAAGGESCVVGQAF